MARVVLAFHLAAIAHNLSAGTVVITGAAIGVENFFQRIKRWRRTGTRYDKLALHFLAFVQLAAVIDWIIS